MHLKQFGPFTVYWKEADILGPAKLTFSASSFCVEGDNGGCYQAALDLSKIDLNFVDACGFFTKKSKELRLTTEKNKVK